MSSDKNRPENNSSSDIDWTPENEIKLFYALRGHKPVGKQMYNLYKMRCHSPECGSIGHWSVVSGHWSVASYR